MPIREFVDSKGLKWRVWSTTPAEDSPLRRYYPEGWLTFDSGAGTLRRLSPTPAEWHVATDERLELLCRVAEEVPRHTGERLRIDRPADFPPREPDAAADDPVRGDDERDRLER
jgi:hypothetical protein